MSTVSVARATTAKGWSSGQSLLLLTAATLLCLLPFCGRAFHIDDSLFLWCGQQIVRHPFNPFGFQIHSNGHLGPMWAITKNPPLACYYLAIIGKAAGFSERALHLGFLLPAVAMVLGTYRLAQRFTRSPLIAAAATLLTPGVLVSASSVMCDTLMLAFWVWAAIFWLEGLDAHRRSYLLASAVLLSASALSKYFGICLVPLLLVYSLVKYRRLGAWAGFFVLPLAVMAGYELWTRALYGQGMFGTAAEYAPLNVLHAGSHVLFYPVECASFIGGCALPALVLAPLVWSRKSIVTTLLLEGVALTAGLYLLRPHLQASANGMLIAQQWNTVGLEFAIYVAGGISVLALAATDLWQHRDPNSLLLALWVFGTFLFTAFVNWTINARSVLPLIPAVGILLARRIDGMQMTPGRARATIAAGLLLSGGFAFWTALADANLANNGKAAAERLVMQTRNAAGAVWFQGRCDFQYYMEERGQHAFDFDTTTLRPGDILIVPMGEFTGVRPPPPPFVSSVDTLEMPLQHSVTTFTAAMGAGFYSSRYGPLPFAVGKVPPERFAVYHMGALLQPENWHSLQP